jgi:hypothetical protein
MRKKKDLADADSYEWRITRQFARMRPETRCPSLGQGVVFGARRASQIST